MQKRTTKIAVMPTNEAWNIIDDIEVNYKSPAWVNTLKDPDPIDEDEIDLTYILDSFTGEERERASISLCRALSKLGLPFKKEMKHTEYFNTKAKPSTKKTVLKKKTKLSKKKVK